MRYLAGLMAAALLLGACGATTPAQAPPRSGGTLDFALDSDIATLDPSKAELFVEGEVLHNLYDSLIGIDTRLRFVPELATSWEFPDLLTLVLHLRSGVTFHDGTPFDAAAVKFNLERDMTPGTITQSNLASLSSVEVRDPHTAVLHLKRPDGTLLAQLVDIAGMMLSPSAVDRLGDHVTDDPVGAGSGPFQFVEWQRGDHITLKRDPGYWRTDDRGRALPYLDQVRFRIIADPAARVAALSSGAVQALNVVRNQDIPVLKATRSVAYSEAPGLGFFGMVLNHTAPPFSDPEKSRAVALALDRAGIIRTAYYGVGMVSHGPLTRASWAYDPSERLYDRQDLAAARAAATGFRFSLKATDPIDVPAARQIQAQLGAAGITVDVQPEDFNQMIDELSGGRYDALLVNWYPAIDPDGNTYALFHTGGGFNQAGYSNPRVDQLLEHARLTTDQAKRRVLYQEAQRLFVQEVAWIFIRDNPAYVLGSTRVRDLALYPDDVPRLATVWLTA